MGAAKAAAQKVRSAEKEQKEVVKELEEKVASSKKAKEASRAANDRAKDRIRASKETAAKLAVNNEGARDTVERLEKKQKGLQSKQKELSRASVSATAKESDAAKEVDLAKSATMKAKDGKDFKELKAKLTTLEGQERDKKTAVKNSKEKAEKQNKSLTTELEGVNSRLELARQSQKDIAAQYKEAKTGAAQAQEQIIGGMKAMFDREQNRALQEYRRKESMLESMVKAYEQRIAQSKTQKDKRDAESKETKAKRDIQAHQAILPKIKAGTAKEHTDKLRLKTNLETLTAQVQREKADEKATKEKATKYRFSKEKVEKSSEYISAEAADSKKEEKALEEAKEKQNKSKFKDSLENPNRRSEVESLSA